MKHMFQKINIVRLFLYGKRLHVRQIANLVGVSPASCMRYLQELEKDNILESQKEGLQKVYAISLHRKAYHFVCLVEKFASYTLLSHKDIASLVYSLQGLYEILIIYGSFAKGTFHKNSDIDVVIIGGNKKKIDAILTTHVRTIQVEYCALSHLSAKTALVTEIKNHHVVFGHVDAVVRLWL
ncbi:MAG: nucleotidyltransferase domain-containing protein [Candidatus Woesearchaeota archaeon]